MAKRKEKEQNSVEFAQSIKNSIVLGDCIEKMRALPDSHFDLIIADPPYNIGKNFGNNFDSMEIDDYLKWTNLWLEQCFRLLKDDGSIFIYGFSEILAKISASIRYPQRWLVWHYTNKNVASLNFWQRSHESIILAWKKQPKFFRDNVREPYTEAFLNNSAGKIRKDTAGRFSTAGTTTVYNAHEGGALPRDVLKIPALAGGAGRVERWFICLDCDQALPPDQIKKHTSHKTEKHPTQKPKELTRRLIRSCMPPGVGEVLIPFAGTGSECVVAKEMGLNYTSFELNPLYIKLAEAQLSTVKFGQISETEDLNVQLF
jgi:site-specific DNA-methyltransferase (adenine-specific)